MTLLLAGLVMTTADVYAQRRVVDSSTTRNNTTDRSDNKNNDKASVRGGDRPTTRDNDKKEEAGKNNYSDTRSDKKQDKRGNTYDTRDLERIRGERADNSIEIRTRTERTRERDGRDQTIQVDRHIDIRANDDRGRAEIRINTTRQREQEAGRMNPNHRNYRTDLRYNDRHMSCRYCHGHGYTFGPDGFHRINCPHCQGVGFRIFRELVADVCNLCWNPLHADRWDCSLEELASRETDRLDYALDLSNYQYRKIYAINLKYLERLHSRRPYPVSHRDRAICRILNNEQEMAYIDMVNDLRRSNICMHCAEIHF